MVDRDCEIQCETKEGANSGRIHEQGAGGAGGVGWQMKCTVLFVPHPSPPISPLFSHNAVYHRGNRHLDVWMWGRWEVKTCYSWQEA